MPVETENREVGRSSDRKGHSDRLRKYGSPFAFVSPEMHRYVKDPCRPVIGKRTYGVVYRVKCRLTNEEFALKCHIRNTKDLTSVEDSSLAALQGHPNIIQLLECFVDDRGAYTPGIKYICENVPSTKRF
uniref:Protein kinase domain-containing protein n=1 Tax=Mastacembelus armatus TaxID=205130 RepID=A0A3Q3LIS1_9TELE